MSPRLAAFSVFSLLVLGACGAPGTLPTGAELGSFSDVGDPESYSSAALYTYMNGGAEIFLEYSCQALSVRRYSQGADQMTVELFEMRDPESAAALYTYMRRPGAEAEIAPGCRASITPTEVLLARGNYYLACRNDDPMATSSHTVQALTRGITTRLVGDCGSASVFGPIRDSNPVPGSEIAIRGPLGLGVRPWLGSLGKNGFERGWLASYRTASGSVEAFLGEYQTPELARKSITGVSASPYPELKIQARGRRVVILNTASVASPGLSTLIDSLLG